MFIDIHTHQSKFKKHSVYNVVLGEDNIPEKGLFSMGLHPWNLESYGENLLVLESALKKEDNSVTFIGECGLDKAIETDIKFQENIFKAQILLSEEYEKPLIIHCVKAYNELIVLKKAMRPIQPWVVHGFNKKIDIAQKLIKEDIYLSFGFNYLKTNIGVEVLNKTPLSQLFFETDNNKEDTIEETYALASKILEIELDQLKEQVKKNLWKVTGWKEQNY